MHTESPVVRAARPQEAAEISELAMRSKAHWGYSQEFMEVCRKELTVTPGDIFSVDLQYWVAEWDSTLVGYYALEKHTEQKYELEALFVEPVYIGRRVGKALLAHAKSRALVLGATTLVIQGDPNAAAFYLAAGGKQVGTHESASIPGRNLPLFEIELKGQ
jgi:GNAT superfamily N-acetyltransferase